SFVGMYTALGPHLEALGLDTSQVIWIRAVGLPGMFVSLAVGPLSQRLGMAGVARTGYLLAAAGIAAEALLARSLIGLGAASLLFVAGVALAIPAMITLFGETAAPNRAGGIALNGCLLVLGASIGPLAARGPSAYAPLRLPFRAPPPAAARGPPAVPPLPAPGAPAARSPTRPSSCPSPPPAGRRHCAPPRAPACGPPSPPTGPSRRSRRAHAAGEPPASARPCLITCFNLRQVSNGKCPLG